MQKNKKYILKKTFFCWVIGRRIIFCNILLIFWLFIIILIQINPKLSKYDKFNIIPIWQLFAPRPIPFDYIICYLDIDNRGNKSNLKEINMSYNYIYANRLFAALIFIMKSVSTIISKGDKSLLEKNKYYQILVNHVKNQKNLLPNPQYRVFICLEHNNGNNKVFLKTKIDL